MNIKQKRILSSTLAVIAVFMIISGLVMNSQVKPIVHTKYTVTIEKKKIAETQAKTDEIKVKDIEIEINNPISVDIKDYLDDIDKLKESTIKSLKLDTSLVNINQAGDYKYTIIYGKKKYIGNIKVKAKELPNVTINLKTISLKTKESLSSNPRTFIEGEIPEEVYNNLTLDISKVDTSNQGDYTYYVIYKGVTYQGKVEVRDPGPTIITPAQKEEPKDEEKTKEEKPKEQKPEEINNGE
ncbi:MAG: hypothetical protein IJ097_00945 [Bacilli bacterium]|nr:hypothetical protein [Bacilli bacterium]